jgi:uncharacterized membrane protein
LADDDPTSAAERRIVLALAIAQGALLAVLGLARWKSFHNETFDLAFYTRMAWGLTHSDFWEPIVNGPIYGLHLSPVLVPLGWLGSLFGTAPVLLIAQSLAIAGASIPISKIGARHLGPAGAIAGAIAWLFHPNLGHVGGYEFHPGTLSVLGLAWMVYAIDRGSMRAFALASLFVLTCREDLALAVALASILFVIRNKEKRLGAAIVGGAAVAYACFFLFVVHPAYAPAQGSLQLHFGRFGNSTSEVAIYLLTHPLELAQHLATRERLLYLPMILAPFAFLPLLKPSWLLPALPILAVNLVSDWPTAQDLDVHYLTPALPFLAAAALEGSSRIARRAPAFALIAIVAPVIVAHGVLGGTPLSLDFEANRFRADENSAAARAIVTAIPPDASVQAPDALLPHLAERPALARIATAERGMDYVVLDVSHRQRFAADEDLLRTTEEPFVRAWLAREDHRLVAGAGDFLLLERGSGPREGAGGRAILGRTGPEQGTRIAACLAILGARIEGDLLEIDLVARSACPNDLAIRLGTGVRPRRVDLLFGGWLSPGRLERGDRLRSLHRLDANERAEIEALGLRVGALRSSGARPEPSDPTAVYVTLSLEP